MSSPAARRATTASRSSRACRSRTPAPRLLRPRRRAPRGGAAALGRADPQPLHPGRRRPARSGAEPQVPPQARLPRRAPRLVRRGAARGAILVGDLNVAPREDDVWNHSSSCSIVSHTPVEVAAPDGGAGRRRLGRRHPRAHPRRAGSIPGGPTARPTGRRPTRAGGSTTSGRPPISPRAPAAAASPGTCAAGRRPPTTSRSSPSSRRDRRRDRRAGRPHHADRPEAHNALDQAAMRELTALLADWAARDELRALVLPGRARASAPGPRSTTSAAPTGRRTR